MFAALRRLLLLLTLAPACSVVNADHCANLEGDATCRQRDPDRPFCSQCAGDNNGCFADLPDELCHAVTVAQPASTSSATTTSDPTTSSSVDPTTTVSIDDTTSTSAPASSSSSSTSPTTTLDTSSSSSSSDASSSDTTDTSSTTDDTTTGSTSTSTGTSDDTGSDSGSDTGAPFCGDKIVEGDEVCDGTNLDTQTCKKLLPDKWGGGTLKCTKTCKSFDDTDCCIGVGQPCNYLLQPDELCCAGLGCPLSGKCTVKP